MAKKIKSYNRLYVNGKPVGKAFPSQVKMENESEEQFKKRALSSNNKWNAFQKKQKKKYSVKLEKIGTKFY